MTGAPGCGPAPCPDLVSALPSGRTIRDEKAKLCGPVGVNPSVSRWYWRAGCTAIVGDPLEPPHPAMVSTATRQIACTACRYLYRPRSAGDRDTTRRRRFT